MTQLKYYITGKVIIHCMYVYKTSLILFLKHNNWLLELLFSSLCDQLSDRTFVLKSNLIRELYIF
jgi:hypothetical protein